MDNGIALADLKHTVLVALADFKYATNPEEWETAKLEALQILDEIITQNRVS